MKRWFRSSHEIGTRAELLVSPGFVLGLSLLLLNDFVFKRLFHGMVTGKLSDFAGLFVFPLFWVALSSRLRAAAYGLTAAIFVFWKSSYSQPLIDTWNTLSLFSVSRSVDYGDLVALTILPWSYHYSLNRSRAGSRSWIYAVGVASILAFTATSYSSKTTYDTRYDFQISKRELLERMSQLSSHEVWTTFWDAEDFEVTFDDCVGRATIAIGETEKHAVVTLKEIDYRCPTPPGKDKMQKFFEQEFIGKLNEPTVTKPAKVSYIWGIPKKSPAEPTPSPKTRSKN